jgi:hypothetical protein
MLDSDNHTNSQTDLAAPSGGERTRPPRKPGRRAVTRRTVVVLIVGALVRGALMSALPPPSTHGAYPAYMRVVFMAGCEHTGGAAARPMCGCTLSKLEARYSASRVEAMSHEEALDALRGVRGRCLPSTGQPMTTGADTARGYPHEFRVGFLSECEHPSGGAARPLCECVLARLEAAYPALAAAERLTERQRVKILRLMGVECVRTLTRGPTAPAPVAASVA